MKKIYAALLLVLLSVNGLKAQYTFTDTNGVYTPLTGADTLDMSVWTWDDDYVRFGLPFQVNVYGAWYDSVLIDANSTLVFYNDWTGLDPWDVNDTVHVIMPFGEFVTNFGSLDLASKGGGQSPILYEVSGNPGARIMKLEWRNAGFYEDTSAMLTNFVNFQVWIHEFSSNIECHYGTSYVDANSLSGETGPVIGIAPFVMNSTNSQYLVGNGIYVSGSSGTETDVPAYTHLNGLPADSSVYLFYNLVTVEEFSREGFSLYPNPASEYCFVNADGSAITVTLTDASGRMISEEKSNGSASVRIDLNGLQKGIYFVSVQTENTLTTKPLIIQ
jgi:hypothetical protein